MKNRDIRPWLALRAVPGVGDATMLTLVEALGSPDDVLKASEETLIGLGCQRTLAQAIRMGPSDDAKRQIDREIRALDRSDMAAVAYFDESYPPRLRTITDPPAVLYVSGHMDPRDHHAVAIVGARRASQAGRLFTEELSRELAAAGFTIVSGLAIGVDAAAHRGALAAAGRTIAVLGCGIDRTYPVVHAGLRRRIEQCGAVISELPMGSAPHGYHFPRRNRIISGLSLGVVVTEATLNSGSLITAGLAADQGREVFAVPGMVKADTSRGPNSLIKAGAKLVETANDVIDELLTQVEVAFRQQLAARRVPTSDSRLGFGNEETLVYDALSHEPQSMDAVIRKTGLNASQVSAALLALELKNCVRQLPGNEYLRP
ncbi:MAG TPA: DNA-processing protein DprA [Nitrospiraceae bacterium]|nr:DNA-processing protein DprA [Nitrospiraceae bacterium]